MGCGGERGPLLDHGWIDRIFAGQVPIEVAEAVVAPEQLPIRQHRGNPEDSGGNGVVGVGADGGLDVRGAGPLHRHPAGEVNWCIALEGEPTFMGQPPGWVVEPPGSEHVPTVSGGRMLIVYLLPAGAIEFLG